MKHVIGRLCLLCVLTSPVAAAQRMEDHRASAIRQVAGQSETVNVPMVSEPWSATLGRVSTVPERQIPDFGDFPGADEWKRRANERRKAAMEAQSRTAARSAGLQPGTSPSSLQIPGQQFAATSSGQGVVFDGPSQSDTHLIPPDPQIAAGPNYVVVVVNSLMAIYDKSGNPQGSYQDFSAFFSSLGITGQIFDPRIIYDQTDQRFIIGNAETDFAVACAARPSRHAHV